MVLSSSPKTGLTCNKITRCENLEKCDSTKLEGNHTPLVGWGLHHEDVASTSNPKMTSKLVLCSFVKLKGRKMWPYVMP